MNADFSISNEHSHGEDGEEVPWWDEASTEEREQTIVAFNGRGESQNLGPMLARGGEGRIFPLERNPDLLVKVYHEKILRDESRKLRIRDKLNAMSKLNDLRGDPRFAWPRLPIFNEHREWIGYAMKRCPGQILHLLCSPRSAKETFPDWTRIDLLKLCLNLIEGLNALHRANVMIGDLSTANFLVTNDASVYFIDCDAYHVEAPDGRTYPCEVRTDLFSPPELLDQKPESVMRDRTHELFSDAVLFYEILMLGAHPYSHRFGQDPVTNLRTGNCPLGRGASCQLPVGPWRNLWSHLTYNLKNLFLEAFREGHANPYARPPLRKWKKAIIQCMKVMHKPDTENSSELLPLSTKTNAYVGRNREVLTSIKSRDT